jgi:hypothetical protein
VKQILGYGLIAAPFVCLFAALVHKLGWELVAITIVITLAVSVPILVGLWLVTE